MPPGACDVDPDDRGRDCFSGTVQGYKASSVASVFTNILPNNFQQFRIKHFPFYSTLHTTELFAFPEGAKRVTMATRMSDYPPWPPSRLYSRSRLRRSAMGEVVEFTAWVCTGTAALNWKIKCYHYYYYSPFIKYISATNWETGSQFSNRSRDKVNSLISSGISKGPSRC